MNTYQKDERVQIQVRHGSDRFWMAGTYKMPASQIDPRVRSFLGCGPDDHQITPEDPEESECFFSDQDLKPFPLIDDETIRQHALAHRDELVRLFNSCSVGLLNP